MQEERQQGTETYRKGIFRRTTGLFDVRTHKLVVSRTELCLRKPMIKKQSKLTFDKPAA